jgi:hypothetical protein
MRCPLASLARSLFLALALASCTEDAPPPAPPTPDSGALVDVELAGRVGVLLDELPGQARERLATTLLAESKEVWAARARRQVEAATYRLTYRNLYYESAEGKGQLPLPPPEQWRIELGDPERSQVDGHDLVVVAYTMRGTLLAPLDSPGKADAALARVGGVVEVPFTLPADPEHLLERTGFACMNEDDFPPNSVDTENARQFFDDTCEAGLAGMVEDGCHVTADVMQDCVEALRERVGAVETVARFTRVAWDAARADAVRVGAQVPGGAQLRALEGGLTDHRIIYRYFSPGSCAIAEGCVGGPGWRRLLQFTATVQNLGAEAAAIEDVGPGSPPVLNNMVSLSQCHQHMHFNHYGRFTFGTGDQQLGGKRAFCLESTSRYFNNEATPLTHPYGCHFQGVAAGWGDDYIAGLDCQWVDITPVQSNGGVTAPLGFVVNPDDFLCEGRLRRAADGTPLFEQTSFTSEDGRPESRFQCDFFPDHAADNAVSVPVRVPEEGGMVTEPCARPLVGDKRNCGFTRLEASTSSCAAGASVKVLCTGGRDEAPAAVRLCEGSHRQGGVPCVFRDALATAVVGSTAAEFSMTCPAAREASAPDAELGGLFATFVAPMVPGDDIGTVRCNIVP